VLIKALIFDLDGTLVNSVQDLTNSINHARSHFSLPPLSTTTVATFVGDGVDLLIERSFTGTSISVPEAKPIMAAYYEAHLFDQTRPYPGVPETLQRLPFRKVVATNKSAQFSIPLLKQCGLLDFFEVIIGGESLPVRKPDPAIVAHLAAKLEVKPDELVMVGDHRTDLEMATLSGIRSVFCEYGIRHTGEFRPTWRIQKFPELIELFSKFAS